MIFIHLKQTHGLRHFSNEICFLSQSKWSFHSRCSFVLSGFYRINAISSRFSFHVETTIIVIFLTSRTSQRACQNVENAMHQMEKNCSAHRYVSFLDERPNVSDTQFFHFFLSLIHLCAFHFIPAIIIFWSAFCLYCLTIKSLDTKRNTSQTKYLCAFLANNSEWFWQHSFFSLFISHKYDIEDSFGLAIKLIFNSSAYSLAKFFSSWLLLR